MAVLVGIDEAGFGPILGPLVVSSTTFALPPELVHADLWHVLRKSVGRTRKRLAGRLLIADSKKAFSRASGIMQLQRTVLAALRCLDRQPRTLSGLLALICPACLPRLARYPWYSNAGEFQLDGNQADVEIASAVLADDLAACGIRLLDLNSFCFDVALYNSLVRKVKNKASVLFTATAGLIQQAFDAHGLDQLQIVIDRQGGRVHYRKPLQRMFEGMELRVLAEDPRTSSYELKYRRRTMRLHFVVSADDRFLPVALASMVSKYIRELLVASINRYFADLVGNITPTAGYWKDGLRFFRELKKRLPDWQINENHLLRCR